MWLRAACLHICYKLTHSPSKLLARISCQSQYELTYSFTRLTLQLHCKGQEGGRREGGKEGGKGKGGGRKGEDGGEGERGKGRREGEREGGGEREREGEVIHGKYLITTHNTLCNDRYSCMHMYNYCIHACTHDRVLA